jgi:hypothetical protein
MLHAFAAPCLLVIAPAIILPTEIKAPVADRDAFLSQVRAV